MRRNMRWVSDKKVLAFTLAVLMVFGTIADTGILSALAVDTSSNTNALFYDSFDNGLHESWNFTTADNPSIGVTDGAMQVVWDQSATSSIVYGYVDGSDEWDDYSVSADVCFSEEMTDSISSGSYVSLVVRRTGTTYYDLHFVTCAGSISLELYQYVEGERTLVKNFINSFIEDKLGNSVKLSNGQIYNLKVMCKSDNIYIYLDNVLLGMYTDATDTAPKKGRAGMKLAKVSATIDNYTVSEKGSLNIEKIEVEGLDENEFEIYEGFDIEAYNYMVHCYDADGTVISEILTPEMLSSYDNQKVGTQNITITAQGATADAVVKVLQRDDYITQLENDLEELNVSNLTLQDVDEAKEILARYDELSAYEISKISQAAIENAASMRTKIEVLQYPELASYDVLYHTTFTSEAECDDYDWYNGFQNGRGDWEIFNGAYRVEQKSHGISNQTTRVLKNVYGQISSVSAKMQLLTSYMYGGVMLNVSMEGQYTARVDMATYNSSGVLIPKLQVLKGNEKLASVKLADYGVNLTEGDWFDIRLTYIDGTLSAYVNDTLICTYETDEDTTYSEGRAGVVIWNGNGKFDNFTVRGVAKDIPASAVDPVPTEYQDDFEDEISGQNPDYWVEETTADDWKAASSGNNTYYGTAGKDAYTSTWLHVFEKDPTVTMDFMYDATATAADIGFYIRMAPDTAYVKVGYDVAQQRWYVIDTQAERDSDVNTTYSEQTYIPTANEWHSIKLEGSDRYLTVTVDDEVIFNQHKVSQVGYGRIGVYCQNAGLYIDNVTCEFPNGDVVQDGLIEYTMSDQFYDAGVDITVLDENNIIGLGVYGSYFSTDGGESFDIIGGTSADDGDVVAQYEELTGKGGYQSVLRLHDGSLLIVHNSDYIVNKSTDNLETWKNIGRVVPKTYLKDNLGRRNVTSHNNSLTEVQLPDGTWRVFMPVAVCVYPDNLATSVSGHYTEVYYSDDGGVTWEKSRNDTRDITFNYEELGNTIEWSETKIIKCADGSLRMYLSRAKYGCMQYSISYDGGETWEGQYSVPELQTAKSSFNIIQDTDGTYYLVWVNNNPVRIGATFSRTRLSLARSTDGMNWEFLCDLERMSEEVYGNDMTVTTPLMQLVDPSIEVDKDYVYITVGRSGGTDNNFNSSSGSTLNYHNALRPRMIRIEKSKLQARAWDASTISDMLFVKSMEVTEPIKTRFEYGDTFTYLGGKVMATRMDGTQFSVDMSQLILAEEPDIYTPGTQDVVLYNSNGTPAVYQVSFAGCTLVNEDFENGADDWAHTTATIASDSDKFGVITEEDGNKAYQLQYTRAEDVPSGYLRYKDKILDISNGFVIEQDVTLYQNDSGKWSYIGILPTNTASGTRCRYDLRIIPSEMGCTVQLLDISSGVSKEQVIVDEIDIYDDNLEKMYTEQEFTYRLRLKVKQETDGEVVFTVWVDDNDAVTLIPFTPVNQSFTPNELRLYLYSYSTADVYRAVVDNIHVYNLTHTLTYVAEAPADHQNHGVGEHYACSACGEIFSDKEGVCQIDSADLQIEPYCDVLLYEDFAFEDDETAALWVPTIGKKAVASDFGVVSDEDGNDVYQLQYTRGTAGACTSNVKYNKSLFKNLASFDYRMNVTLEKSSNNKWSYMGVRFRDSATTGAYELRFQATATGCKVTLLDESDPSVSTTYDGTVKSDELVNMYNTSGQYVFDVRIVTDNYVDAAGNKKVKFTVYIDENIPLSFDVALADPACNPTAFYLYLYAGSVTENTVYRALVDDVQVYNVSHTMQYVGRVNPTDTAAGHIAHYKCTTCDEKFSDEAGSVKLTDTDITIPQLPACTTIFQDDFSALMNSAGENNWTSKYCTVDNSSGALVIRHDGSESQAYIAANKSGALSKATDFGFKVDATIYKDTNHDCWSYMDVLFRDANSKDRYEVGIIPTATGYTIRTYYHDQDVSANRLTQTRDVVDEDFATLFVSATEISYKLHVVVDTDADNKQVKIYVYVDEHEVEIFEINTPNICYPTGTRVCLSSTGDGVLGHQVAVDNMRAYKTTHKVTAVEATPSTKDVAGVKAHYACSDCGKKFMDEAATIIATDADLAYAKLSDVLYQTRENQTNPDNTDIRFVAYVDDYTKYSGVKFTITSTAGTGNATTTTVYKKIKAADVPYETTDVYGVADGHFATFILKNCTDELLAGGMTVTVTWIATDGTTTTNEPRAITSFVR